MSSAPKSVSSFLGLAMGVAGAALLVGHLLAQTPAPQQQPPRFAAGTDLVVVDALVVKDGKPVTGLTASDFTVTDSGVVQQAQLASIESLPVSLLLALDTSASVRGQPLDRLKEAAKAALASLRPTDQASLLTFSHNIALGAAWTDDRTALTKAIDAVTAQGSTSLTDAAFTALGLRARPATRTLLLLFTDGDDTASWLPPSEVVIAARRTDTIVYGISLAAAPKTSTPIDDLTDWMMKEPSLYRGALLPVLAHETGGEWLHAASAGDLQATFTGAVARFNTRYVLTFTPTGVPAAGWHPLDVQVKSAGAQVTARRGYSR